ncbi:GDP-L-fucose synthase [Uliginosibacterium paludis]|uniref:GDP-L-fucose synthase n=2 Tax=Uliginosibacterium paludis TaxID=1615952 RepID=A0ABV2CMR2_9RHOO
MSESVSGRRVWVTGHRGMLGAAMVRRLEGTGAELLLAGRSELDLTRQSDVYKWAKENKPELVFHIGAKVGGIHANATLPGDFLRENLLIQTNVMDAAFQAGVKKLVFVASNCTYPTRAELPIKESSQLTGALDESIRSYAISKIAGIEMCRAYKLQYGADFVAVIPPNLYGPGDNYHPEHSHVVAGILRRVHEAKISGAESFVVWGDGTPRRELLHVDDLADAMLHLMNRQTDWLYNIGYGTDLAISEIAALVAEVVGYKGAIVYDKSKPNGTMKKLLDSSRINQLGWFAKKDPKLGLKEAYADFLSQLNQPERSRLG